MAEAYPLDWPDGWPRAKLREDGRGRFARGQGSRRAPISMTEAAGSLYGELERMGAVNVVVSSNLQRRLDGGILARQSGITDPGIAVYFSWKKASYVMARDQFDRAEDNLRSLALAIEGLRQMERHGGSYMMERAFTGFAALPPPDAPIEMPGADATPEPWYEVLGVSRSAPWSSIRSAYRDKIRDADDSAKLALNLAYEAARAAQSS